MRNFLSVYDGSQIPLIGREKELELIKNHFLSEDKRVCVISGTIGSGKTTFWNIFRNQISRANFKVYYLYAPWNRELENLTLNDGDYVVLEEFNHSNHNIDLVKRLYNVYRSSKFIFVTQNSEVFLPFPEVLNINLNNFDFADTSKFFELNNFKLSKDDLTKILAFTFGNPRLLNKLGSLIEYAKSVDEIIRELTSELKYSGIVDVSGNLLNSSQGEYKQIIRDIKVVNTDILKEAYLKPDLIYNFTPRQFENFVAELLSKLGYTVELTKETRDGGKDIIVAHNNDLGKFLYYVECKRYGKDTPVGVRLVRELYGTISTDRVNAGVMVTSSYFSPDAIEFCEQLKTQISLVDYFRLQSWVHRAINNK